MYQFNPFEMTFKKFDIIISKLKVSIQNGNYLSAEQDVALLREYVDCYYCQAYRKDMASKNNGVCDNCPVHKIGEMMVGRRLFSNGCYRTGKYKEMVRLSWYYKEQPSFQTATELIKAIEATKAHMAQYKSVLDKVIYKDI